MVLDLCRNSTHSPRSWFASRDLLWWPSQRGHLLRSFLISSNCFLGKRFTLRSSDAATE
jgi:Uma2 family endonuclease